MLWHAAHFGRRQDGYDQSDLPDVIILLKVIVSLGRDPFVETGFCFESETGFSFGMYVKQTVSIQPVSMDS